MSINLKDEISKIAERNARELEKEALFGPIFKQALPFAQKALGKAFGAFKPIKGMVGRSQSSKLMSSQVKAPTPKMGSPFKPPTIKAKPKWYGKRRSAMGAGSMALWSPIDIGGSVAGSKAWKVSK
jgi:hypothetical protein